jgi:glycosyltransferase involved in cell wall biosynthesis
LKILHLLYESEGDSFGVGGVSVRAYQIYSYLKDTHEITLLCKRYPGAQDGVINGIRHMFVGTESMNLTKTFLSYSYHAARFVKKYGQNFDIIIEEFSPAIPTFLHFLTKKPLILQVQGYTGTHYFSKYNPAYALALYIMEYFRPRFYDNYICINTETVKKLSLGNGKFVEIIPNGVPPELLAMAEKKGAYILYIGRIEMYGKGLDILIHAYEKFQELFSHTRLVIAGDGKDKKIFESRLAGLQKEVREKIHLEGWVSGVKKREIISNALFCVIPSRHEVQPLSALEVMACAKPMIVSDIPEFNFVIKHKAGVSFTTGNQLSLAKAMKGLMINNEKYAMGLNGRNYARAHTWDRIARRYEDFLFRTVHATKGQNKARAI